MTKVSQRSTATAALFATPPGFCSSARIKKQRDKVPSKLPAFLNALLYCCFGTNGVPLSEANGDRRGADQPLDHCFVSCGLSDCRHQKHRSGFQSVKKPDGKCSDIIKRFRNSPFMSVLRTVPKTVVSAAKAVPQVICRISLLTRVVCRDNSCGMLPAILSIPEESPAGVHGSGLRPRHDVR